MPHNFTVQIAVSHVMLDLQHWHFPKLKVYQAYIMGSHVQHTDPPMLTCAMGTQLL